MKKLMTIREASEMLALSIDTLYHYTHKKRIPYVKLYGRVLFIEKDLTEWMNAGKVHPQTKGRTHA
jgi:excisionase family DNA binding protein